MRLGNLVALHIVALMLAVGSVGAVRAEQVSIMVGGIEKQIYLPLTLADRLGYFKDEGLNVEILSEPAGVEAADEMLAGAVQGVVGFYDHNIQLQSLGKYTESVVQLSRLPGEVLLVSSQHPEITSMADLKGHRVGVTGLGASTEFLTHFLAVRAGLKSSEITPVPVGAGDTLITALAKDRVQAAMTTEPTVSRLLSTGKARVLVDLRSLEGTRAALGGLYPAACLYMESSWVERHHETVQKLVRALVRALHFIAEHTGSQIADEVSPDFYAADPQIYVSALDAGKDMFTPDGRMPPDGPRTVLTVLAEFMPGVRADTIDLSRTFTTAFVDALR